MKLRPGPWGNSRRITFLAYALLPALFAFDVVTPQILVAEITYEIPVLLAAFTGDRKLTWRLLLFALLATEVAAIVDAAAEGFRWDVIGIENRALSILSLLIVAALTLAVQRASERLGRASADELQRVRSTALSVASDHLFAALSTCQIDAAIVREAAGVFGTGTAFWQPAAAPGTCWLMRDGEPAQCETADLPAGVALLLRESVAGGRIGLVNDPAGGAGQLLSIPVSEAESERGEGAAGGDGGALLVLLPDAERIEDSLLAAATFRRLVLGALAQVRLTTDLATRNAALNEKQEVIEGLIDAIAHDLRTPLAALSVTLQQACDGAYGALPAEYAEVLRESRTSIEDIRGLAETLLIVARLESGGTVSLGGRVRLDVIAKELASEFRAMASARNVEIVTSAEEQAATVAVRADLRRAVANLLANAIQHMPGKGTVELSVCRNGASVDVIVQDDGYGIDERLRANLFERFSRGAKIATGSGLGLYIVRRVAEEVGGQVRYEPRLPRGSRFVLSLPAAA